MRHRLEYLPVRLLALFIGVLPRPLARAFGISVGMLVYALHFRLRRVGMRNLDLAFPAGTPKEKTRKEKNKNFSEAQARGKGVVFLTAHLGGWEVSSFAHSLYGHPMNIVIRPLDNPYVDALVDRYRTLHGNRTFPKQDFARGLLTALRSGETVGILMDTNMTPPQGAFVDFFGVLACTATGLARVALHTDAAVLPAFGVWDKHLGKYKICFEPALKLVRSGDDEADAVANTALFTQVIEGYVAKYPEQWLWVHRRWKTRPPGEVAIY